MKSVVIDYEIFSDLRRRVKRMMTECRLSYIGNIEEKIDANPKAFFAYTKSLHKSNSLPNIMRYGSKVADKDNGVCDLFAEYFASVYCADHDDCHIDVGKCQRPDAPDVQVYVTLRDIKDALLAFDECKVSSPDDVPILFFKRLSATICVPLALLFNKSLSNGKFPSLWKVSHIAPIYKSGKKAEISNYRPISILPAISKIFEKIVAKRVMNQLHHMISLKQHGIQSAGISVSR